MRCLLSLLRQPDSSGQCQSLTRAAHAQTTLRTPRLQMAQRALTVPREQMKP